MFYNVFRVVDLKLGWVDKLISILKFIVKSSPEVALTVSSDFTTRCLPTLVFCHGNVHVAHTHRFQMHKDIAKD